MNGDIDYHAAAVEIANYITKNQGAIAERLGGKFDGVEFDLLEMQIMDYIFGRAYTGQGASFENRPDQVIIRLQGDVRMMASNPSAGNERVASLTQLARVMAMEPTFVEIKDKAYGGGGNYREKEDGADGQKWTAGL